jgi:hypothetical protein
MVDVVGQQCRVGQKWWSVVAVLMRSVHAFRA